MENLASSDAEFEQHAKIDLDVEEIEAAADAYDFTEAMRVYASGGNSLTASGSTRTLKGFATAGDSEMTKTGNYEETWFPIYKAYWTAHPTSYSTDGNYADGFITGAAAAGPSVMKDAAAAELIKGGIKYQAVWMYALHKFEEAIGNCFETRAGTQLNSAWGMAELEAAWAYYVGSSLAGATHADANSSPGRMLFALARERAADFGTLRNYSTAKPPYQYAEANSGAFGFLDGAREFSIGMCDCSDPINDPWYGMECRLEGFRIQLTIPLVQGVLKYAWLADPANGASGDCNGAASQDAATVSDDCARSWARGWASAAAVLPQVDNCDATATSGAKLEAILKIPIARRDAT